MPKKLTEPKISETHIQGACCDILALDGWRRVRTDMKQLRGMGVQEPGMADDLFIRYGSETPLTQRFFNPGDETWAQVMWIEWKRIVPRPRTSVVGARSTRAAQHQTAWHTLERKRGALTLIAGEDFPASIEGFKSWYVQSGLMRNRIL